MTVSKKYNDNLVAGGAVRDGNGNRIDTTYAKIANLASVATTGNYNDLINKPVVNQTYDGTSANAQSGIAVEQAINTVKRNIGEVVTSTIPLTDACLHLLDGSLISGSGVYAEFVEYIASLHNIDTTNIGTVWTTPTEINLVINDIAYGNGIFVAVSNSGWRLYSLDNGQTWIEVSGDIGTSNWSAVTYGNGVFICTSSGGYISTSTDGINWTNGVLISDYIISDVAYGNGLFVAVGALGYVYVSSDNGANWATYQILSSNNDRIKSICYVNSRFICTSPDSNGYAVIYESTDGSSWSTLSSTNADIMNDITYGNGKIVMCGANGNILYSENNGQTWELISVGSSQLNAIEFCFDKFVAVGVDGTYAVSDDGFSWTSGLLSGVNTANALCYAEGVLILGGRSSTNGVYALSNGEYPAQFATESDWQNSATTYGVCGKFVYDSVNNTVRLPKITGFTEGTTDVNTLGDLTEAGLPNITGSFYRKTFTNDTTTTHMTGAFTMDGSFWDASVTPSGANKDANGIVNFNASLSNPIYGNSTTVQPQSAKVLYYIVVATSAKTDIQVDIDNVVTDINYKADVDGTNMIPSVKNFDGQWVVSLLQANSATAIGTVTIDLSSYLPQDNYNYEVMVNIYLYSNPSSGNTMVFLNSDIIDNSDTWYTRVASANANSRVQYNRFIIPVGSGRWLKRTISEQAATVSCAVTLLGYRRIGTNS